MQKDTMKTAGHAVYALHTHIVFVTKYRHECLTAEMLSAMKVQVEQVCEKWRSEVLEFNGEADHVHLLVSSHPTVAISDLVANLKTVTARRMRSEFAQHLKRYYWKPVFWSASYAAFSVGAADLKTVVEYIRNQSTPAETPQSAGARPR